MQGTGDNTGNQPPGESFYEDEIDLRELLLVLWRYRALILGVFLAAVVAAGVISFLLTPVYEVKATLTLGNVTPQGSSTSQPVLSPAVAQEMLQSGEIFNDAAQKAGYDPADPSVSSCRQGFKVVSEKDTNLVRLTMETPEPSRGLAIMEKLVANFQQQGNRQLDRQRSLVTADLKRINSDLAQVAQNIDSTRQALDRLGSGGSGLTADLQQARLLDALSRFQDQRQALLDKKLELEQSLSGAQGIQVIAKPAASAAPVKPRKKLNMAVAGVLGLMVGVFAAFTLDYFRRNPITLKS